MCFLLGLGSNNDGACSSLMTAHQEMQYFISEPSLDPDPNPLE